MFSRRTRITDIRLRGIAPGFTLIEILLAVALTAMIGIAVYRALASGIMVWQYSSRVDNQSDAAIFLEQLTADLKNAFVFSKIKFTGGEHRMAFATIVHLRQDRRRTADPDEYLEQIGQVEYTFDVAKREIVRRSANYGQALKKTFAPGRVLVKDIRDLNFRYYYRTRGKLETRADIDSDLPQAIEVTLDFGNSHGKQQQLKRLIVLPGKEME